MSVVLFRRAFRRSRVRVACVLVLHRLVEASVSDLAVVLGVEPRHVAGALMGGPEYRLRDSLVRLGLVKVSWVGEVAAFSLTESGREVALRLRAEGVEPPRAAAWAFA